MLNNQNVYAIPITHYNFEMAGQVRLAFEELKPDCIAVELAETMQLRLLHAASRLPDISFVLAYNQQNDPIYYLCEPADALFEGLRCALEHQIPAYCIDLDIDEYPDIHEPVPDAYAIQRIGLKHYYDLYQKGTASSKKIRSSHDTHRELYMAKRLKELSLSYDKVLFIGGIYHVEQVLHLMNQSSFPPLHHAERDHVELCTLTEESCREVLAECGWFSKKYEEARQAYEEALINKSTPAIDFPPDRQKLIYALYKESSIAYQKKTGNNFPGYDLRNTMKFVRNYALTCGKLMPDLYQILSAAKGCVNHNYAYEVWVLATEYPFRHNIDNLQEFDLSIEQIWGKSKLLRFHLKQPGRKSQFFERLRKDRSKVQFSPPGPFTICSYPPEDVIIEKFGDFLKKKGTQILTEEGARTLPFSTSLEEGIDTKETIRHCSEKKLYVKVKGKPPGGVGSLVVIFDEDSDEENPLLQKEYPWKTTWIGEHNQESDMAFYATSTTDQIIGPGISRCQYGGFMMSYPPRRLQDIWRDPDYQECRSKPEVLLMAAVDYAIKPLIVYVAAKPPRSQLKSFAKRYGKKIVYLPIGQLSRTLINKLRVFHVIDGHDTRRIADEYIF
jgi:hypothetical protein